MAESYKGLTIKFGADDNDLSTTLKNISKEANTAQTQLKQVQSALKLDPGNTKLLAQQQEALAVKVATTKSKLESYNGALETLKDRQAENGTLTAKEQRQYDQLTTSIATTEARLKSYTKQLEDAQVKYAAESSALGSLGTKLTNVGTKYENVGNHLSSVGSKMSLVTAGEVGIAAAATNLALDFDTSMSQLAGSLGVPVDSIENLRQLAIQTGQDTIYSASEAGSAMVELAKGGMTEADIEGGALAATMDLAASGSVDLTTAATDVVQVMGAFHLSAADADTAVNALAGGANASSADVSDLTEALSQVSAVAYSAGWSVSDTTATLAAFADAGITGSDAGTSLKTMLLALEGPSSTAKDAMDEYNISLYNSDGSMKSVGDVADNLQTSLSGLSNEQRNAALTTIFGSDATRAATVLYDDGSSKINEYEQATSDQTAAQTMANAQLGEGQSAIENMKGAIETAGITIGETFAPIVTDIANAAGDAASAFSNLDSNGQRMVLTIAGIVAAIGPVLSISGNMISNAKNVGAAFSSAASMLAKFGGATKTVTAATKVETVAVETETKAMGASAVAMGAAKLAMIGLAAVCATVVVAALYKAWENQQKLTEATDKLRSAQSDAESSAKKQAEAEDTVSTSVSSLSDELKTAKTDTENAISAQAEMASTIEKNFESADVTNGQLETYKDTINQLANQSGLTADQQAALKLAVDGINSSMGTSYSVVDAANGKIADQSGAVQDDTTSINNLIDAKMRQNQIDALDSAYKSTYTQQAEDAKALTEDIKAQSDAQKQYDDAKAAGLGETEAGAGILINYKTHLDDANATLDAARKAYDADTDSMSSYTDQMNLLKQAQDAGSKSVQASISNNSMFIAEVEGAGKSVSTLASQMSAAGITSQQFSSLSSDQLAQLASDYDGSTSSIIKSLSTMGIDGFDATAAQIKADLAGMSSSISRLSDSGKLDLDDIGLSADDLSQKLSDAGVTTQTQTAIANGAFADMYSQSGGDIDALIEKLKGYDSTPIVDKDGNVTVNDVSLTDAQGNVYTWNGSQVIDKDGNAVVDDLSLTDAQGNLVTWNDSSLTPQSAAASVDDGSLTGAQGDMDTWNRSSLVFQSGYAAIDASSVDDAISKRDNWNANGFTSWAANAVLTISGLFSGNGNASGGIKLNAAGGIQEHADGYIATKPHMIDPHNLVGEAGAEAIIPLTNKRYVTPFAHAVAEQMESVTAKQNQQPTASTVSATLDARAVGKAVAAEVHEAISNMGIYVNENKFVGATADAMNVRLGTIQARSKR